MKKRCDIWVNSVVLVKFVLYVCLCSQSWGLTASWLMNERTITTSDVLYTSPFDDTTGIIIWATPSPRHFSLNINVIFIFCTVGWNNSGSDVTLHEQPTSDSPQVYGLFFLLPCLHRTWDVISYAVRAWCSSSDGEKDGAQRWPVTQCLYNANV